MGRPDFFPGFRRFKTKTRSSNQCCVGREGAGLATASWLPPNPHYLAKNSRPAATAPYELGAGSVGRMWLRGKVYLAAHNDRKAADQFHKILDHPGLVWNTLFSPLAHLGLGRAYALSGDTTQARNAYQDFFALWKDGAWGHRQEQKEPAVFQSGLLSLAELLLSPCVFVLLYDLPQDVLPMLLGKERARMIQVRQRSRQGCSGRSTG